MVQYFGKKIIVPRGIDFQLKFVKDCGTKKHRLCRPPTAERGTNSCTTKQHIENCTIKRERGENPLSVYAVYFYFVLFITSFKKF